EELSLTAFTRQGEVMGIRHRTFPLQGVQFHPESILTPHGKQILRNFMEMSPVARMGSRSALA
ncbi:MAG: glutamine amidotransferase-related protein, partial [Acidobacteriota bacterium]